MVRKCNFEQIRFKLNPQWIKDKSWPLTENGERDRRTMLIDRVAIARTIAIFITALRILLYSENCRAPYNFNRGECMSSAFDPTRNDFGTIYGTPFFRQVISFQSTRLSTCARAYFNIWFNRCAFIYLPYIQTHDTNTNMKCLIFDFNVHTFTCWRPKKK